jgi:hypothetical protein
MMKSRSLRSVVALMLCVSIGLHWMVLQSVAWVGMMVSYTQSTGSLATAAEMTFDGEHPCSLCRVIEKGKQSEQPADPAAPAEKEGLKVKFFAWDETADDPAGLRSRPREWHTTSWLREWHQRSQPPMLRPPKPAV